MTQRPDVSVIIVNWNVKDLLVESLRSLVATRGAVTVETIVVDNGSTDGSVDAVRRNFPAVTVVANAENLGFSAANNQGMALATGRYLLLLNPDTLWVDGSLTRMVRFLDDNEDVGAIGPKLLNADTVTIQYWGGRRLPRPADVLCEYSKFSALFPKSRLGSRYLMSNWDHEDARDVECISGACLMVRRTVTDAVGTLDEEYPLYFEDTDWCHRIRAAKWRIHYLADAKIIHFGQQSSLQNRGPATVAAVRGVFRYYRKFHGREGFLFVWFGIWLISAAKLAAWITIGLLRLRPGSTAVAQARAYWSICKIPPVLRMTSSTTPKAPHGCVS